jgi:hypothetical protein
MILTLPLRSFASQSDIANLESRTVRRFPIDVAQVFGPAEAAAELRLRLPDGWRARLPNDVDAVSDFGTYRSSYRQEGRDLVVTRLMSGRKGIEPREKIGALIAFLRAVAGDDVRYIVLERTS